MPIRAVVFDVGETLIDETRVWGAWADWFGVPHLTLFGVLGGLIARGEDFKRLFEIMRPGRSLRQEWEARAAAGREFWFDEKDLYPDAAPCLAALRAAGYRLGIAGNQPDAAETALNSMGLDVDMVASSQRWGVEKPSAAFYDLVERSMGVPAAEIAYVGDRVDNDVIPAVRAGMFSVFLRRGPWGYLHADLPEVSQAHLRLDSLRDLPDALAALGAPDHKETTP
ncbi:MAG TPA: HAD family hydrolase [Thermomicrobiales bacterium]|nr:HAD family hydrolase [Thermomicrobiales bacterium]